MRIAWRRDACGSSDTSQKKSSRGASAFVGSGADGAANVDAGGQPKALDEAAGEGEGRAGDFERRETAGIVGAKAASKVRDVPRRRSSPIPHLASRAQRRLLTAMFLAATPSFVGSSTASAGPATTVDVTVGRAIATTGPNFVCWNLDASRNREFFDRNLSTSLPLGGRAARLASALGRNQAAGHSLLRFGGSGNDYLRYEFGGVQCPPRTKYTECMNQSSWTDLLGFADAADARMIVGLSMQTGHDLRSHRKLDWLRLRAQHVPVEQRQRMLQQMRHNSTCEDAGCRQRMLQHMRHNARAGEHPPPPVLDGPSDPAADGRPTRRVGGPGFPFPWDPTEARHLLQWTQSRGLDRLIAGFELGNEQNIACAAAAHAIRARNFRAQFGAQFFRRAPFLPSSSQVHGGAGGDQLRRAAQPDGRTVARRVDAAAALRP